jgi:hypothetical protein
MFRREQAGYFLPSDILDGSHFGTAREQLGRVDAPRREPFPHWILGGALLDQFCIDIGSYIEILKDYAPNSATLKMGNL